MLTDLAGTNASPTPFNNGVTEELADADGAVRATRTDGVLSANYQELYQAEGEFMYLGTQLSAPKTIKEVLFVNSQDDCGATRINDAVIYTGADASDGAPVLGGESLSSSTADGRYRVTYSDPVSLIAVGKDERYDADLATECFNDGILNFNTLRAYETYAMEIETVLSQTGDMLVSEYRAPAGETDEVLVASLLRSRLDRVKDKTNYYSETGTAP